jgi:membrane-bound lytic murein transglycosylase D
MGATGIWQFMYGTGKQYNLKIDSYIDERSDPLKSTSAASEYMSKMFNIFGDWELVLASYNSGPGNVTKAIRRSGGKTKYWDIRNHLPKETQGYVPAFLATMYLFEFHKEHGINPERAVIRHFETDTIQVKEKMTFKQIADLLDMPQAQIQLLNPSYKLNVVPYYSDEQLFLRLPKDKAAIFASNEEKIYAYVRRGSDFITMPSRLAQTVASAKEQNKVADHQYHKVKKGDNLGSIARKYNVTVADLKKLNKLKSNAVAIGKSLKVKANAAPAKVKAAPEVIKKPVEEAIAAADHSEKEEIEVEYVVKSGDNLGSIAKKFGVSVAELKEWNELYSANLAPGKKLVVVKGGETVVPTTAVASNTVDSFKKKAPSAASLTEEYYVKKGDSLYSISKKYPGVTIADLKKWNGIKDEDIKPGMKLKING